MAYSNTFKLVFMKNFLRLLVIPLFVCYVATAQQRVGIGTIAPKKTLDVNGSILGDTVYLNKIKFSPTNVAPAGTCLTTDPQGNGVWKASPYVFANVNASGIPIAASGPITISHSVDGIYEISFNGGLDVADFKTHSIQVSWITEGGTNAGTGPIGNVNWTIFGGKVYVYTTSGVANTLADHSFSILLNKF